MKPHERQLDLGDSSWNIRPQQTDEEMAREIEKGLAVLEKLEQEINELQNEHPRLRSRPLH